MTIILYTTIEIKPGQSNEEMPLCVSAVSISYILKYEKYMLVSLKYSTHFNVQLQHSPSGQILHMYFVS
jgi:hypothetical protein